MDQCTLLGLLEFPGGTCAQWFSGSASALAVAVAVGAHFYTAWRQRQSEAREDAAEIAGVSMLIRAALSEAAANASLFLKGSHAMQLWGETYTFTRRLGAVRATQLHFLDKKQADVLLRSDASILAENIDGTIGNINLTNLGIEDYSRSREEFSPVLEKYLGVDIEEKVDRNSDEGKILRKRLSTLSRSATHFVGVTQKLLQRMVRIADDFNAFCSERPDLAKYCVATHRYVKLLQELEEKSGQRTEEGRE